MKARTHRRQIAVAVAIVVTGVLVRVGEVEASCGASPRFAPATGASLPRHAVVYFFNPAGPRGTKVRFTAKAQDGLPLALKVERVSAYDAYAVYRIDVTSRRAFIIAALPVFPRGAKPVAQSEAPISTASYRIAGGRKPARQLASRVRVIGQTESHSEWTCSWQSTRNLRLNVGAPAFRVEWAFSAKDFAERRRESRVLPSFGEENDRVELGHVDCLGRTFDWDGQPAFVGLTALHEDGSETPPESAVQVDPIPTSPPGQPPP